MGQFTTTATGKNQTTAFIVTIVLMVAMSLLIVVKQGHAGGAERQIRIVNGQPVVPGSYPFLTAVLPATGAKIEIGTETILAEYFGGSPLQPFAGEFHDCGLALSVCAGANGKICSVTLDYPQQGYIPISPTSQLDNCVLGGGAAAVFQANASGHVEEKHVENTRIPAVYVTDGTDILRRLSQSEVTGSVETKIPDSVICGGSYIGGQWVLTAAHCVIRHTATGTRVVEPKELLVQVAAHDVQADSNQAVAVVEIVTNGYTEDELGLPQNDYALLRIATVPANDQPIALISEADLAEGLANGSNGLAIGWGSIASRDPLEPFDLADVTVATPHEATLQLLTNAACGVSYNDFLALIGKRGVSTQVGSEQFCAHSKNLADTCQGDSGGPLIIYVNGTPVLAGITSYGFGCGTIRSPPGVYVAIPPLVSWIENITGLRRLRDGVFVSNVVGRLCIDSEPVGDGWGWDGEESCRLSSVGAASAGECVDTGEIGDGWGWDGVRSCIIVEQLETIGDEVVGDCVDVGVEGDGWGWNGIKSCLVTVDDFAVSENSQPCIDTGVPGDGWGWDGVESCRVP